jgi:hypothetical protein
MHCDRKRASLVTSTQYWQLLLPLAFKLGREVHACKLEISQLRGG